MSYEPDTKVRSHTGVRGTVVENYKLPGDICIDWETGQKFSYDEEWLQNNTKIDSGFGGGVSDTTLMALA